MLAGGLLPGHIRKQLSNLLPSYGSTAGASNVAQMVSGILGLPTRTVYNTVQEVNANGLQCNECNDVGPAAVAAEQSQPAAAAADPDTMKILVRQVLYNAVRGRPFSQYPDDILMLRHHGIAVGTTHHSEKFPPLVETAAAKLLRQMQQKNLADVILGGLGIPSDLECICDAGTLGKWYSRASETFLLVGIVVSTKHGSQALFLDAVNQETDARGQKHAERLAECLTSTFGDDLHKRLACVCADGALVKGGPAATHPSTNAAKHFWDMFDDRQERSIWDPFHLFDSLSKCVLDEPVPREMILARNFGIFFGIAVGFGIIFDLSSTRFFSTFEREAKFCSRPIQYIVKWLIEHFRNSHALHS